MTSIPLIGTECQRSINQETHLNSLKRNNQNRIAGKRSCHPILHLPSNSYLLEDPSYPQTLPLNDSSRTLQTPFSVNNLDLLRMRKSPINENPSTVMKISTRENTERQDDSVIRNQQVTLNPIQSRGSDYSLNIQLSPQMDGQEEPSQTFSTNRLASDINTQIMEMVRNPRNTSTALATSFRKDNFIKILQRALNEVLTENEQLKQSKEQLSLENQQLRKELILATKSSESQENVIMDLYLALDRQMKGQLSRILQAECLKESTHDEEMSDVDRRDTDVDESLRSFGVSTRSLPARSSRLVSSPSATSKNSSARKKRAKSVDRKKASPSRKSKQIKKKATPKGKFKSKKVTKQGEKGKKQ